MNVKGQQFSLVQKTHGGSGDYLFAQKTTGGGPFGGTRFSSIRATPATQATQSLWSMSVLLEHLWGLASLHVQCCNLISCRSFLRRLRKENEVQMQTALRELDSEGLQLLKAGKARCGRTMWAEGMLVQRKVTNRG